MRSPKFIPASLLALALLLRPPGSARAEGGLSPEESLKTFELDPAFKIEVFAAEPHVVDPVVMTFDERGRIFVGELREMEVLPALTPGSRATIRLIEDRDGDGRIDHSTVFADGLSFPTGLAPWRGGIFAICTPDLLYLKDTDGDGVADERRVVLTGFAQGNAEHRFNNLQWGLDNWIYAANGHGGGKVFDPSNPGKITDLSGRDLRFRPEPFTVEAASRGVGGGFGLSFDDWGRRYVCQNEMHALHVVLAENYLEGNKFLSIHATGEDISGDDQPDDKVYPISKPQGWRIERTQRRAKTEADRFRPTQLQANGYFTAACGITIYRGGLFPDPYRGNLFVCDAAGNLVHRSFLTEAGASMHAERATPDTEFLRSSDSWFRPVNLSVGPDGALYVVDFYREIIETAASIPPDIVKKLDLRAGSDKGRIYRIVLRTDATPFRPYLIDGSSPAQCLKELGNANAWQRTTAQRLLVERGSKDAVKDLRSMALNAPEPVARLHALWTLEGLHALDDELIEKALHDAHPRIREHALMLAERLLKKPE